MVVKLRRSESLLLTVITLARSIDDVHIKLQSKTFK